MREVPDAVPGPVERVRLAVSLVPEGRVASYGDIDAESSELALQKLQQVPHTLRCRVLF